jgi:aubergine-like protein
VSHCLVVQYKILLQQVVILSNKPFSLHREEIAHRGGGKYRDVVQKSLIGVVVLTRYNNKTYRVDDIDWDQSPRSTFHTHREGEVSISYGFLNVRVLHIMHLFVWCHVVW